MESRFGHDFSQVRIHSDAPAASSARDIHALAYTAGSDVVFGAGRYSPESPAGRHLLAHELAHVVQQSRGGRVVAGKPERIVEPEDESEQAAESAAQQVVSGATVRPLGEAPVAVRRVKEPYISAIDVNLSGKENAQLTWKGAPPQDAPGEDSFTVSTGKGYSEPDDKACKRHCCSGADVQCDAPFNGPGEVGSCCTPKGTFWTGVPEARPTGWQWWTPVQPIYAKREIALHTYLDSGVTGDAIGHGCIRMNEPNAHRIYLYSRGKNTAVNISGKAQVDCPAEKSCDKQSSGASLDGNQSDEQMAQTDALVHPDSDDPSGGGAAPEAAQPTSDEAVA